MGGMHFHEKIYDLFMLGILCVLTYYTKCVKFDKSILFFLICVLKLDYISSYRTVRLTPLLGYAVLSLH